jgi:hypothetical protein
MNIETLQIKRVTGKWNDTAEYKDLEGNIVYGHKNYVPKDGELVYINVTNVHMLVLGNGVDSLESLANKNGHCIPFQSDIKTGLDGFHGTLKPDDTIDTTPITSDDNNIGSGDRFAYSDHTHKLEKPTSESILGVNTNITTEFNCRRIKAGTLDPLNPSDASKIGGNVGDIYIRYE